MHRMHKRISNIIGLGNLPRAVVKVRVPRGPGAVEGERQLLVVLVLLTPHPKGGEHLDLHVRAAQDQHDCSATQAAGRKERACAPGLVPFTHGTGRRPSQAVHRRKRQVSARAVRLACRPPPHASSRRLCARLKMGRGRTRGGQGAWDVLHYLFGESEIERRWRKRIFSLFFLQTN